MAHPQFPISSSPIPRVPPSPIPPSSPHPPIFPPSPPSDRAQKPEYAGVAHWWRTSLYNAELLLHHRLRNHLCLTPHPSQAHLFYVPFYPGTCITAL
ncbi:unnamed protein product [Closterium sp. NIES-54]